MTKAIVRLGDPSDHGGTMITAGGSFRVDGITVCVDQDMHQCPIKGHGVTPVTSTTAITKTNGKGILRVGDRAGCGAVIIKGSDKTRSN